MNVTVENYDKRMLIYFCLLTVFGTVMLYSSSWYESFSRSNGQTDTLFLQAHLKRILIGMFFLFYFLIFDFRKLKTLAPTLIFISIALLIITKGYYLFHGSNKPARWLSFGFFSFQTSDIARFSVIIYCSYYLDKIKSGINSFQNGYLPISLIIVLIISLIIGQPDYSTAIMIGLIGFLIIFIAGARLIHLISTLLLAILFSIPILMLKPYRWARLTSYFSPDDIKNTGYQAHQSLISLGNGGWLGVGLGNSIEKNHFLPTPHTDVIFAIIGEELGFLFGSIPLITIFIFIFFRGITISKNCTDPFGILLAVGISTNMILYAFVNIAVVTGLFPVTGLPIPMVSYGGSGLIINMALFGILLNISQSAKGLYTYN